MSEELNPRVIGLVRARANQIRAANPEVTPEILTLAVQRAAVRLCSKLLRPGGTLTFDDGIEVAALAECLAVLTLDGGQEKRPHSGGVDPAMLSLVE